MSNECLLLLFCVTLSRCPLAFVCTMATWTVIAVQIAQDIPEYAANQLSQAQPATAHYAHHAIPNTPQHRFASQQETMRPISAPSGQMGTMTNGNSIGAAATHKHYYCGEERPSTAYALSSVNNIHYPYHSEYDYIDPGDVASKSFSEYSNGPITNGLSYSYVAQEKPSAQFGAPSVPTHNESQSFESRRLASYPLHESQESTFTPHYSQTPYVDSETYPNTAPPSEPYLSHYGKSGAVKQRPITVMSNELYVFDDGQHGPDHQAMPSQAESSMSTFGQCPQQYPTHHYGCVPDSSHEPMTTSQNTTFDQPHICLSYEVKKLM